jgi:hypothetical protein
LMLQHLRLLQVPQGWQQRVLCPAGTA